MDLDALKSQLSNLAPQERAELAYFLLDSLEPEEQGAGEAWREEIARRLAEIRSGKAVGIPAGELFAELRELYA